ncbi:sulfurtransferase [Microvirga sp. STS02]|uniref:sulfurtransferase n=1 Tax=Hymenobacter negativus TaxID=2795026 RepID=UPI0018DC5A9F|nr:MULTISPECIES: sulfurtransferase [Bacteria]MBH8570019.1 sulfurtransferase [Hymenobacter negativus]MBR7209759.1 sulfurtransferase [Microvirga sp. STS02]
MKPLITAEELYALGPTKSLVLIDARSGREAYTQYQAQHLREARHVDLDQDLAAPVANAAHGGRHPLPTVQSFAEVLGRLGIGPESRVVVYDDKAGANAAARFWWMLTAVGHRAVQVLDGGLAAALASGYPTSAGPEAPDASPAYAAMSWQLPTVTIEEVERATQTGSHLIIDVREGARYRGEIEPIDLVAGHIPTAVNIPFSSNLAADGSYLAPELLREKYAQAMGSRESAEVIVHCGSGVTACHTLLAMAHAGLPVPNLYVGSWSEWSRTERPIATGLA